MNPQNYQLEFVSAIVKEDEACYSVDWTDEQIIWVSSAGRLWSRQISDGFEKSTNFLNFSVHCIRSAKQDEFALLCYTRLSANKVIKISNRAGLLNAKSIICKYPREGGILAHISVSDTHIAVCDNEKCIVRIFDRRGIEIGQFGDGLFHQPFGVFLHNDSVLVSDKEGGNLYKFKLYDVTNNQVPVWTCSDLSEPTGICVDQNGIIHVGSACSGLIHLISPQGLCLHLS